MPRRIVVFFVCALLCLAMHAAAYSVPDDTVVYITPSGECYHRDDCSYTSSVTVRSLTISEAEQRGYRACSRCNPDVLTGVYVSSGSHSSGGGASPGSSVVRSQPSDPAPDDAGRRPLVWVFGFSLLGSAAVLILVNFICRKIPSDGKPRPRNEWLSCHRAFNPVMWFIIAGFFFAFYAVVE